jgi:PAS domain S-box-containing protein
MKNKTKILIVEHDPNDIELIQYELKIGGINYESKIVQNEKEFIDALGSFIPDIILSDFTLPHFDGLSAFNIKEKISPDTSFIFVSGTVGEEKAVELIKSGVTDYALKDKLFALIPKINRALKEAEEQKEKKYIRLQLIKANHLYAFISQVNQGIVHVKDEASLFKNACNLALEFGKFKMAWIGLFDKENKKITLTHQSGVPDEALHLFYNAPYQHNGPQDYVLRTGTYYICNNVELDLELKSWQPFAAKYGIRSCLVLPINKSGITIGTFNLYSAELNFSGKEELKLLIEVTKDISFALDIFEKEKIQRTTEELVIKNEKRFRALVENELDGVVILSKEGGIVYSSPSVQKILGYSVKEITKINMFTLLHAGDSEGVVKVWEQVMANPGVAIPGYTGRMLHKNGTWRWLEATVTNLLNDPAINGIVDNFRDVTDKIKAEEQKEFDSNNLNALINNTEDLMWSVDRNFNLITSNEPLDKLINARTGKLIIEGNSMLTYAFSKEQADRFKSYYERAFTGERFSEIETTTIPVESWSEISYSPIRSGKEVIGAACHSRNITSIKTAEQRLRKSEAFNRGVLNSLKSHIAVVDVTGTIVAVNENWKRYALSNGEATLQGKGVGSNYFNVCTKAANEGVEVAVTSLQGMKDVMEEKINFFSLEYPCHSPQKQQWFEMRVMKFDNEEQLIVVAHTDITEVKKAKLELDNTLKELEHRVKTRTKELFEKNKDVLDSINYAKRIQVGLLSSYSLFYEIFPKSFIFYLPKDIVSGDFFWCYQRHNKKIIIVADCTGHGVPGALMSIIGNNLLNTIIVNEHVENPSEILEKLDTSLKRNPPTNHVHIG